MAVIKRLSGDVSVTTNGKALTFTNYGFPLQETVFAMNAANTGVFEDGTGLLNVIVPPARGHLVARPDGRLSYDINNDATPGDVTFSYEKTVAGSTETINGIFRLSAPVATEGWDEGAYYLPEVDAAGDIVFEPAPGMVPIHCATDGLDSEAIKAREPAIPSDNNSNQVAEWCLKNEATGESGAFYGETEALALAPDVAQRMVRRITLDPKRPNYGHWGGVVCLLFKRGQVFPPVNFDVFGNGTASLGGEGYSMLHPNWVGTYGSGDRPYFQGDTVKIDGADRLVLQGLNYGHKTGISDSAAAILSGMIGDFQFPQAGNEFGLVADSTTNELNVDVTLNKMTTKDVSRLLPQNVAQDRSTWSANADRISGGYMGDTVNGLLRKVFTDQNGWKPGYRADGYGGPMDQSTLWLPQTPSLFNQGFYIQTSTRAITVIDFMSTRNSLSALQVRGAGTVLGFFSAGNNAGLTVGRGWFDNTDPVQTENGPFIGHYGFVDDTVHTHAGAKDTWNLDMPETGKGHTYTGFGSTFINSAVINSEWAYPVFANDQELGPQSRQTYLKGHKPFEAGGAHLIATLGRDEVIVSNWNRDNTPDQNAGSVSQSERDALQIEDYASTRLAQPSTLDDLCAFFRSLEDPTVEMRPMLDYFLQPFGKGASARAVPETVYFRPDAVGGTPAMRTDVRSNWTTFDLPGDVAGDNVHLEGHRPVWHITPRNVINDFTFGAGGSLRMFGGALKPQGSVNVHADGNSVTMDKAAKFDLPGYAGAGVLSVEAQESRFRNTGSVTGNVDVTARYRAEILFGYDNADFTLAGGRTATIYGHTDCGFDGALGGASTLTLASGSTLAFKPAFRSYVTNRAIAPSQINIGNSGPDTVSKRPELFPKAGTLITGDTSGATARVVYATRADHMIFDDLNGIFAEGETFTGQGEALYTIDQGTTNALGRLNDNDLQLGAIRKFRSGITGFNPPNVTANVIIQSGATLAIDVTALPNGTYALIEADSISGSFDTVVAAGNAAKDLTIATSGTLLELTIADGTGVVSQI